MRISDWSSDVCSSDLSAAPWSSPRKTDRALASLRGSCCLHSSRRSPGPLPLLPNMLPLSTGNVYEHEVCHVAHPYREPYIPSRWLLRGCDADKPFRSYCCRSHRARLFVRGPRGGCQLAIKTCLLVHTRRTAPPQI